MHQSVKLTLIIQIIGIILHTTNKKLKMKTEYFAKVNPQSMMAFWNKIKQYFFYSDQRKSNSNKNKIKHIIIIFNASQWN